MSYENSIFDFNFIFDLNKNNLFFFVINCSNDEKGNNLQKSNKSHKKFKIIQKCNMRLTI